MWHTDTREALGSLLQIQFSSPESTREICISEIFGRIDLFEKKYSRFCSGNTLESINSCIGSWQEIDPETRLLLSRLDALLGKRDLGFSLAVKKNLESLGYDRHYSFLPQSEVTRISPGGFTLRGGELLIDAPVEFGGFGK